MTVKRYTPTQCCEHDGTYVTYSDYQKLVAENAALRRIALSYHILTVPEREAPTEPEIDAAIAEIKAQGVALAMQNVKDIAHCLSDIRRFVEVKFMTVGDLPSQEGLLLSGPEWKHESDAIIAALNRVADFYEGQVAIEEIGYEEAYSLSPNNDRPDITHGFKFGWNSAVANLRSGRKG